MQQVHLTLVSLLLASHTYDGPLHASPPDLPPSLSDEESAVVSSVVARRPILIEGAAPGEDPLLQLPPDAVPKVFQPLPPLRPLPRLEEVQQSASADFLERNTWQVSFLNDGGVEQSSPRLQQIPQLARRSFLKRSTREINFLEDGRVEEEAGVERAVESDGEYTDDEEEAQLSNDWILVSVAGQQQAKAEEDEESSDDDEPNADEKDSPIGDRWLLVAKAEQTLLTFKEADEYAQHNQRLHQSWEKAGGEGTYMPGTRGCKSQKIGRSILATPYVVGKLVMPFVVTNMIYRGITLAFDLAGPHVIRLIEEMAQNSASAGSPSWVQKIPYFKEAKANIISRIMTNGAKAEYDDLSNLVKAYYIPIGNVLATGGIVICNATGSVVTWMWRLPNREEK